MATQLNERPGYMIDHDHFNQQTFSAMGQALLKKDPLTKVDKAAFCFTVMETFDPMKAKPDQFQDFLLAVKFMIDTRFEGRAEILRECIPKKKDVKNAISEDKPGSLTGRTQPIYSELDGSILKEILSDHEFVSTVALCYSAKQNVDDPLKENREQDLISIASNYRRNNKDSEEDELNILTNILVPLAGIQSSLDRIKIGVDSGESSEELIGYFKPMIDFSMKDFNKYNALLRMEMVKIFSDQPEIKNSVKPTVFIRELDWVLERIEGIKFLEGMAKWLLSWKIQAMDSNIRQFLVAGTGAVAISAQPGGSETPETDEQKILKDDPSQHPIVAPSYNSQKSTSIVDPYAKKEKHAPVVNQLAMKLKAKNEK